MLGDHVPMSGRIQERLAGHLKSCDAEESGKLSGRMSDHSTLKRKLIRDAPRVEIFYPWPKAFVASSGFRFAELRFDELTPKFLSKRSGEPKSPIR